MSSLLLFFSLGSTAYAEDPEFLLSDLGVRLDLPKSRWRMTKWSTSDFEGAFEGDPVFLYAWSTPLRAPVDPADPWGPLFLEKGSALGGSDASVVASSIHEEEGHKFAFVDVKMSFKGTPIVLRGASTEIDGANFHFAVVSNAKLERIAEKERVGIADRLEFSTPVPEVTPGAEVSMPRAKVKLPAGFRPLQRGEFDQLTPKLAKLGIEDFTSCWLAVRREAETEPEVMAGCSKPLHLGVIDERTFGSFEPLVRETLFGANVPEGSPVEMSDRTGFLFVPRDGLALGAAPDGEHVAVVWALGHSSLGDAVKGALQGMTFPEPHAVTPQDQVSYWLSSPAVLCPLLCCVGGGIGLAALFGGVILLRGRRTTGDEDD